MPMICNWVQRCVSFYSLLDAVGWSDLSLEAKLLPTRRSHEVQHIRGGISLRKRFLKQRSQPLGIAETVGREVQRGKQEVGDRWLELVELPSLPNFRRGQILHPRLRASGVLVCQHFKFAPIRS